MFWEKKKPKEEKEVSQRTQRTLADQSMVDGFRNLLKRNAPSDFDEKFATARPFIFASFIAWPMFWFYRGLGWSRSKQEIPLATYINRTFMQAKVLQIAIIATGVYAAAYQTINPTFMSATNKVPGSNLGGLQDVKTNKKADAVRAAQTKEESKKRTVIKRDETDKKWSTKEKAEI